MRLEWVGHVTSIEEMTNTKYLPQNRKRKDRLEDLAVKWQIITQLVKKSYLEETGCEDVE
jgi:hypothetical protein